MNIQRFLEYIKRQGNKVATFFKSRDVVTFLLFFLLALFMWYSYTASTQREISKKIPIKYIGIPQNVSLEKRLPYVFLGHRLFQMFQLNEYILSFFYIAPCKRH